MDETSVMGAGNARLKLALGKATSEQVSERTEPKLKAIGRRVSLLAGAVGLALGLASCASYHPLPLPQKPNLVSKLEQLDLVLSPAEADKPPVTVDPTRPITPDEVGLLAILNDPDLVGARADLGIAKAELQDSSILPNPSASFAYAFLMGGPGTAGAFTAAISQDIKSILTYHQRVKAATARYDQVNADLLWEEWQVAQKARLLAIDIYGGSKEVQMREHALAILADQLKQVVDATEAGNLDLTSEAPLRAVEAGAERDLAAVRLEYLKNWQELDSLLGLKPAARFEIAEPQPVKLPDDLEPLIESLPTRRPDLIALRLGYDAADADVRAAILGQFPSFSLGYSGGSDTSSVSSGGPQVMFDLPIFDRNQGKVSLTQATRVQLHAEYQSRLDDADGTARGLIIQIRAAAANLERARSASAKASQQSQAAQNAYTQGNLNQRDLQDFQSTALERALDVNDYERKLEANSLALAVELGLGLPSVTLAPQSFDQVTSQ